MDKENTNWLHDLFINEAKAAKDYHNRGGEEIPTQEKTVDITENGTVVVEPDEGHALSKVTANVDIPETPTQEKAIDITENGTVVIEPDEGYALSKATATVNVPKDGVDKIQRYIELQGNSASRLFSDFAGTSVDDLMAGVDMSNVTDVSYMFINCKALTDVPLFDTSNVKYINNMFMYCYALTTVPLFDTSKVTNMGSMFTNCKALTAVPLFDTSNVTDMNGMLGNCSNLTEVPPFNTSKVTNMEGIFRSCEKLPTVPLFDTSKVTNMGSMFNGCYALTTVPLFDTSNATKLSYMFYSCKALTTVPLFDTSNARDMDRMFFNCYALTTVPEMDIRNVTTMSASFNDCRALTECWIRNIKTNLQVGSGTSCGHLLTLESLLHLCKECRNTGSSLKLTMGSANLEKLANVYVKLIDITDEMRAEDDLIDEKSPFVVCESTDEGAMLVSDYMATKMWQLA